MGGLLISLLVLGAAFGLAWAVGEGLARRRRLRHSDGPQGGDYFRPLRGPSGRLAPKARRLDPAGAAFERGAVRRGPTCFVCGGANDGHNH